MKLFSLRFNYLIASILCGGILAFSAYLQLQSHLEPCPLCVLQRLILIVLAIIFFSGAIFHFKTIGRYFIAGSAFLFSLLGAISAGRQVWLQHFPSNLHDTCSASLQYMLTVLPFDQLLQKIFQGSSECGQTGWRFLNLSLAEWSLIGFVIFVIFSIRQWMKKT